MVDELWNVIEPPEFLADIEWIFGSIPKWDELRFGRNWVLERNPYVGTPNPDSGEWVLVEDFPGLLVVVFRYRITEDTRTITYSRAQFLFQSDSK